MLKFAPKDLIYPLKNRSEWLEKVKTQVLLATLPQVFYSHHYSRSCRTICENLHSSVREKNYLINLLTCNWKENLFCWWEDFLLLLPLTNTYVMEENGLVITYISNSPIPQFSLCLTWWSNFPEGLIGLTALKTTAFVEVIFKCRERKTQVLIKFSVRRHQKLPYVS